MRDCDMTTQIVNNSFCFVSFCLGFCCFPRKRRRRKKKEEYRVLFLTRLRHFMPQKLITNELECNDINMRMEQWDRQTHKFITTFFGWSIKYNSENLLQRFLLYFVWNPIRIFRIHALSHSCWWGGSRFISVLPNQIALLRNSVYRLSCTGFCFVRLKTIFNNQSFRVLCTMLCSIPSQSWLLISF